MAVVGVTVTYIIRGPHDPTKAASAFAGWGSQNTERVTLTILNSSNIYRHRLATQENNHMHTHTHNSPRQDTTQNEGRYLCRETRYEQL